jgi:hypothetical protein
LDVFLRSGSSHADNFKKRIIAAIPDFYRHIEERLADPKTDRLNTLRALQDANKYFQDPEIAEILRNEWETGRV